MLTPREATEAPRQWSRSLFSPTEVTESATVLVFLILSALLCSVNNADLKTATWLLYCLRLRSRSPHNAQHSTSYNPTRSSFINLLRVYAHYSDIAIDPRIGELLQPTQNGSEYHHYESKHVYEKSARLSKRKALKRLCI